MEQLEGWLLDVYLRPQGTLTAWLLDDRERRWLLTMDFPITFYAAGPPPRLRAAWRFLKARGVAVAREERREILRGSLPVMAITVNLPGDLPGVYRTLQRAFPDLDLYDADVPLSVRFTTRTCVPLLGRCRFWTDGTRLLGLEPLESRWDLDALTPSLRIMELHPPQDPALYPLREVILRWQQREYRLTLEPPRAFWANLHALLTRADPDLLLTDYGDTWFFPYLLQHAPHLNPNRDAQMVVETRRARSLFAYGQVLYRGAQALLFGRWHIDRCNAPLFAEIGLPGVLELARVTGLGVQEAARKSPGAGITALQMHTALKDGILIPTVKPQAEEARSLADLIRADRGGLIYQPLVGLHRDVAEIDFASMYPSIIVNANISPETRGKPGAAPGLIPRTLQPLLLKRLALKRRYAALDPHDCRAAELKARQTALKWLLVVCFGYLGYKNARFGRVESHEAVTALSREWLLQAKEIAEDRGFTVLHMVVDSLFVAQEGYCQPTHFEPLLEAIRAQTGIGVTLEGIYRWLVFLPSRRDRRVPVPNRWYGVFQDGRLKYRGLALRRHDTCRLVARTQLGILTLLARADDPRRYVQEARAYAAIQVRALQRQAVAMEDLQMAVKLSRMPDAFRHPGPAAQAAVQLLERGVQVRPGMRLRFWYTRRGVSVFPPRAGEVDWERYARLVQRAADEILEILEAPEPLHTGLPLFYVRSKGLVG